MSEKYQKVIEIRGVSPEVFEMILNFIYTSKIKIIMIMSSHFLLLPTILLFQVNAEEA